MAGSSPAMTKAKFCLQNGLRLARKILRQTQGSGVCARFDAADRRLWRDRNVADAMSRKYLALSENIPRFRHAENMAVRQVAAQTHWAKPGIVILRRRIVTSGAASDSRFLWRENPANA
jgi:hypothetical protein